MALSDNLISFWELEEASGTRNDSHGSNHLTDNNTVTSNTGKVNNAAEFVAANNEFLSCADNPSLSTGNINFTLAGWVYIPSGMGLNTLASRWNSAGSAIEYLLIVLDGSGTVRFSIYDTSFDVRHNLGATISTGAWYFIAAICDKTGTNKTYLSINDGSKSQADITTLTMSDTAAPFEMGSNPTLVWPLNGRLDQWGFWKRALTDSEVTFLYNGGAGRTYAEITAGGAVVMPQRMIAAMQAVPRAVNW